MRPNQGEQDEEREPEESERIQQIGDANPAEEREPEESERIQQIGDANPGFKDDDAAEASTPPASSGDE